MCIPLGLEAFFEKTEQQIIFDDTKTKEKISLGLKYPKEAIEYSFSNDSIDYFSCALEDSIFIYYDTLTVTYPFYIISGEDSIKVNPRKEFSSKLRPIDRKRSVKILATEYLEIDFNDCIYSIQDTLISLTDTALNQINNLDLQFDNKELRIKGPLQDTTPYKLTIYPGAISSFIHSNTDTISYDIMTQSAEDFGNIFIKCDSLLAEQPYIFRLIKSKDLISEKVIEGSTKDSLSFINLIPGTYQLDVIEDSNRDGNWTSGSYKLRFKAERQTSKELEKLRKGWDLNVTFDLESLVKKSTQ